MAQTASPSFPSNYSSISFVPLPAVVVPDAKAARDSQEHYPQALKLAAVRYAASCGKSQRAAAKDLGISDGTLRDWTRDAQPDAAGIVDAARFDELAQLRADKRDLLARHLRLTRERDFLKQLRPTSRPRQTRSKVQSNSRVSGTIRGRADLRTSRVSRQGYYDYLRSTGGPFILRHDQIRRVPLPLWPA